MWSHSKLDPESPFSSPMCYGLYNDKVVVCYVPGEIEILALVQLCPGKPLLGMCC